MTDSLLLPFEKEIYWIQHIIIIVIPIYLVTFDTGYTAHRVFQIDRFLQGLSYFHHFSSKVFRTYYLQTFSECIVQIDLLMVQWSVFSFSFPFFKVLFYAGVAKDLALLVHLKMYFLPIFRIQKVTSETR